MVYRIEKDENQSKIKIFVKFTQIEFEVAIKKHCSDENQDNFNKAVNELIADSFSEIVLQNNIQLASNPHIDLSNEIDATYTFAYVATADIVPNVTLTNYKGLNIIKEKVEVSEGEINQEINNRLASKSTLKDVEGPLENGQTAILDFCGKLNGIAFEGGTATDYQLEIGSHTFVAGFEEQMVGMQINEQRNLNITFPENYTPELAGKDVIFEVTLKAIKEKVFPPLSDETIKELHIEGVNTIHELRESIKQEIYQIKNKRATDKCVAEMFKTLKENHPINLPDAYVQEHVNYQLEKIKAQAEAYKIPLETMLQFAGFENVEQFKKSYDTISRSHLHEQVILRAVIDAEKLSSNEEELLEFASKIAKENNSTAEEVIKQYGKKEVLNASLMQKAFDILCKLNIVE